MTGNQENKLTMMKTVIGVLNKFNATWTTFIPFSDLVTQLKATYTQVAAEAALQDQITQGITQNKANLQSIMVATAYEIENKINIYATFINDPALAASFNFTYTQIESLRDTELVIRANTIHDTALANLAALAPYNITALVLTDFKTAIDNFAAVIEAPQLKQNEKKIAKQNLTNLFNTAVTYLKRIDKLMPQYKTAATQFYNEYTEARQIKDLGHRKTRLGLFVELEDGVDSTGVVVVITKGIKNYTQTVRSTDHNAFFESILAGTYTITIHHPGYQPWTGTTNIKSGILNTATAKLML